METPELLKLSLGDIDIQYTEEQINSFTTYLSELKKWNRTYNLTALKTDRDIIITHFIDSLLYLRAIPEGSLKIADAGSGAGFPGIPVKIVRPESDITLIEPTRKKAAFLRHIIRVLKLAGITVIENRIEGLGEEYKKSFDLILSRATFRIKDFLEMACPYVKNNGLLVLSKGPKVPEEIKEIPEQKALINDILRINLPVIKDERRLVILKCRC